MQISGNIAQTMVNLLSEDGQFSDLNFVVAYENEIKPTPLDKPIVAISVKNYEIGDKNTTTLETGEIVDIDTRNIELTLSTDIYLPYSKGGSEGHKIFDRIAFFLLYAKTFPISKAVCYGADYDSTCQAIIVRTSFTFSSIISI
jgi:hypothetical protein